MIEVVSDNIYYKKCKPKKKKRFKRFVIFLLIFICLSCYYRFLICPNLADIISENCYSYSTKSASSAVLITLDNSLSYSELINVEKNSLGDITLITANSYKINLIAKEISSNARTYLNSQISSGFKIPLGAFFGLKIFSGFGPEITLKSATVSSVETSFFGEFKSVGINQTLHSIYVNIETNVVVNIPLIKRRVNFKTPVLISESVIVGKVPDIYLEKDLFS